MDAELRHALIELRERLQATAPTDNEKRELVRRVLADVDEVLDEEVTTTPERHESLLAGLGESMERFEASHPSLTTFMNGVVNLLNSLGI